MTLTCTGARCRRESRKKRFHDAQPGTKYQDSRNSTPSLLGERAHVEKPKAIGPDHVHHEHDEDGAGNERKFQVALFSGSNRLVQAHGPKLGGRIKGATVYERLVGQAALDPLADIGECGGGDASPGTEEDNDDAFDVGL
jgi:hypothetical protein